MYIVQMSKSTLLYTQSPSCANTSNTVPFQVFQAALRARRLNQQCINVLLRQREAVDAAMMLNHAQDARLHGPPLTLASSRTNGGSGAAAQTVGGGGSGSSAGATGVAVGTPYWSVAADGSLPEPNVDVATPSFMQRKAQLRRVFVGGGAATWDAAEREDLSARVIESVRLRLKASVLAKHAPTAQLKEAADPSARPLPPVPSPTPSSPSPLPSSSLFPWRVPSLSIVSSSSELPLSSDMPSSSRSSSSESPSSSSDEPVTMDESVSDSFPRSSSLSLPSLSRSSTRRGMVAGGAPVF